MGRRKGERPYVHPPLPWSEDGSIGRSIRTGSRWFDAWFDQQTRTLPFLRATKMPEERLHELWQGALPTDEELPFIADAFRTDVASLKASIDYDRHHRPRNPTDPDFKTDDVELS